MSILKRKSIIAFIIIVQVGMFAPMLMKGHPTDTAGAPFARPLWWNRTMAPDCEYHFLTKELSFDWHYLPPAIFALNGEIKAKPQSTVRLTWRSPSGETVLSELQGQSIYYINLDGRDMLFKQQIGVPLIGSSLSKLFPSCGSYALDVSGADFVD